MILIKSYQNKLKIYIILKYFQTKNILKNNNYRNVKTLHKLQAIFNFYTLQLGTVFFFFWDCVYVHFKNIFGMKRYQINIFLVFFNDFNVLIISKKNKKYIYKKNLFKYIIK
jgi:hypothetical protein